MPRGPAGNALESGEHLCGIRRIHAAESGQNNLRAAAGIPSKNRKNAGNPFFPFAFFHPRAILKYHCSVEPSFSVTPVKPSSPASDNPQDPPRPGLSKKAKFWIGLSLAVIIPLIAAVLLWLAYLALFPNNPRLVVNSVRLAGNSGYWSPADSDERRERMDRILSILRIHPGRTPMFSEEKDYDLAAMSAKLRQEIPELERADIRRVLPDQIIFELHERIPVANLGSNFYLDGEGTVLDKTACYDISASLPSLACKPADARVSKDNSPFKRGEVLSESSIRTTLEFIRLTRVEFTNVHLLSVYVSQDSLQCRLLYKNSQRVFTILLPLHVDDQKLHDDIFGRLLPKLETSIQNREEEDILDLRFEDRVIARKSS